jgi:hypothetical protein
MGLYLGMDMGSLFILAVFHYCPMRTGVCVCAQCKEKRKERKEKKKKEKGKRKKKMILCVDPGQWFS